MPRFYFNVRDRHDIKDEEGVELPDFSTARREAIRYSGAVLGDELDQFDVGDYWRMEVTDETGLILLTMTFSIMQSPTFPAATAPGRP